MRALTIALLLLATPATAAVKESGEGGFTVGSVRKVAAPPAVVWAALLKPERWWSSGHSWSGSARNMKLDARAGGCFCERWAKGEVEHARVIHLSPGKLLRLRGALGPLQGEALTGTLTFTLAPDGTGTRIAVDYVVGGHARFALKEIAPAVDGVIDEQAANLAKLVGG